MVKRHAVGQLTAEGREVSRLTISQGKARELEYALGLRQKSLERINIVSIVDDVVSRRSRSPWSSDIGNPHFLGGGKGLPRGGPEIVVSPIPSAGGRGIRQLVLEVR